MPQFDPNITIPGLTYSAVFVPGEQVADGGISIDNNPKDDFNLYRKKDGTKDPRYLECLKTAQQLKKDYPLGNLDSANPSQREEMVRRERAVVRVLVDKIHEQYGKYNPAIAGGANSAVLGDMKHFNTDNPFSIGDMVRDTLICRHTAPLLSAFCTEAGLPNFFVAGQSEEYEVTEGAILKDKNASGQVGHAFCVSRLTGNIMDPSVPRGATAYKLVVNGVSLEKLIGGETVIACTDERLFSTYGTAFCGSARQQAIKSERLNKIHRRQWNDLPFYSLADDINKMGLPYEEAKELYRRRDQEIQSDQVDYDYTLVRDYHKQLNHPINGLLSKFRAAIKEGNVAVVRECCNQFPISEVLLSKSINAMITDEKLPIGKRLEVTKLLIDRGGLHPFNRNAFGEKITEDQVFSQIDPNYKTNPVFTSPKSARTDTPKMVVTSVVPNTKGTANVSSPPAFETSAFGTINPGTKSPPNEDLPWPQIIAGAGLALAGVLIGMISGLGEIGALVLAVVLAAVGFAGASYFTQPAPNATDTTALSQHTPRNQAPDLSLEPSRDPQKLGAALKRGTTELHSQTEIVPQPQVFPVNVVAMVQGPRSR